MNISVALRIALRELRSGLRGFWIFITCLALGVGAIAGIGSVKMSIEKGLLNEGAVILGGDAELEFTYRFAEPDERIWMSQISTKTSEIVDFRSMAVVGDDNTAERALTQVKGTDTNYPLYGKVLLEPDMSLTDALAGNHSTPGAVMQQILIDRLGLSIGDTFRLGVKEFYLSAALIREPDNVRAGFGLGPRTIVSLDDLEGAGLLEAGSIFETKYRLQIPPETDLETLNLKAEERFENKGARWHDRRKSAPGVQRFVDRIGAFLVLVGLAGLAVGGIGVSAAVRAYLDRKTFVIATLKTLGANGKTIFLTYLIQVGVMALIGITLGLLLGAILPVVLSSAIEAAFPVPVAIGLHLPALAEAALYGVLSALIFTLWPLSKAEKIRAASLFRAPSGQLTGSPRAIFLLLILILTIALVGSAAWYSGSPKLALWTAAGILIALGALVLSAIGIRWISARLARTKIVRNYPALRLALGAIGGTGNETTSVVLSLGLGLAVLASVGQIDANLRNSIVQDLPKTAPSYFFLDIQPDQLSTFTDRIKQDTRVSRVDTAPMLRGIITHINNVDARKVAGDHWVIRGDRGITYSALPPRNSKVIKGDWWPEDYTGPPLVSVAEEEAQEIGLKLGDTLTVNILGREITATISNFRSVDFSNASINFVLTLNPSALAGAPHTNIATVYAQEAAEAALLRNIAGDYPNITAIRVRDAIARVSDALKGIATATSYGAAITLLSGFVVLIGAAASGEPARIFEAAVLKTLGASRKRILASFALRSIILGIAAGGVALLTGVIAGWAIMVFVMDTEYQFIPQSAFAIIIGGVSITLITGLIFAWRPLMLRPARILRGQE
ncbi:FtsX-like permease family protein [Amylibacter sp. SFDW26]|uniref:ABC transporter permease n=1 Tax=Amylibacter sp. SFDW26 TaxID=2652722 RepID=UPI001261EF95|nr:FtsX-like permease family protein [Amylibacter sp. SFDW26]KAB7615325.1 FtsX-like permease family protein [Amylibacter sp. SFDW26]